MDRKRGKKQICKPAGITPCTSAFSGKERLLRAPKRLSGLIWLFSNSPPEKESHELVQLINWEGILTRTKHASIRRCEWKRKTSLEPVWYSVSKVSPFPHSFLSVATSKCLHHDLQCISLYLKADQCVWCAIAFAQTCKYRDTVKKLVAVISPERETRTPRNTGGDSLFTLYPFTLFEYFLLYVWMTLLKPKFSTAFKFLHHTYSLWTGDFVSYFRECQNYYPVKKSLNILQPQQHTCCSLRPSSPPVSQWQSCLSS